MFCKKCGKEIEDGSSFCPYCGADQNSINEESIEEVQPKKSKKKLIIGIVAGCVCVIAIVVGVVLMKSGSNGTSVFHEHTWVEATCTEPKTCSGCGETEGEALGHIVEVGTCSRCKMVVNSSLLNQIFDNYDSVSNYHGKITDAFNDASGYEDNEFIAYLKISESDVHLSYMRNYLEDTISLCGNYQELSQLKSDTQEVINAMPSSCTSCDIDLMNAWIDDYNLFQNYLQDYYDDVDDLIDNYNGGIGTAL